MTDEHGMTPLPSHQAFEDMLRPRGNRPNQEWGEPKVYLPWVVVCFSANWCGPCKRLDKTKLVQATPHVKWYSCDVDTNDVTLGYCGMRGIPGFALIKDGIFKDKKSGADSALEVGQWLAANGVPVKDIF